MQAFADAVLSFLSANPNWLILIAFAMGFAETMVVIAIFVPATVVLVGMGALVSTGEIPFWPLFVGATFGAIGGSTTAWWLGWRFHEPVLASRPFRNRQKELDRARRALRKWGLWAVFVGHFLAPLRGPVFLLVGAAAMPIRRFLPVTAAGSVIWAYVTPKLGELGGRLAAWLF
ncbi:DedA family protein [Jannaschia pohangensis]|uniref:Membrane protein DedA, SNARE-associated domain n=1 Tax=Jannaschia pohangensis TaxID=390807 RepID=A0A1I3JBU3_9RHOB|nr:DedA family protein [Jannaschia pohangensis]SFI57458.1 membrane protein DedA, SNARE-associated domain [Jannaschia pohangensis]